MSSLRFFACFCFFICFIVPLAVYHTDDVEREEEDDRQKVQQEQQAWDDL